MALDLRHETPRSPFAELDGLPWLARMIDKVRADQAGTLGDYVPFPCPADQRFLTFIGMEAEAFAGLVAAHPDEAALLAALRDQAQARSRADIAEFRQAMLAPATDPERLERLRQARADLKAARPDADVEVIDNSIKLICVDEGHPIPQA